MGTEARNYFITEDKIMSLVVNTNIASLNAQRNLSKTQGLLLDLNAAVVLRPAHQQCKRRCCWTCESQTG